MTVDDRVNEDGPIAKPEGARDVAHAALQRLRSAVALDPGSADLWRELGEASAESGLTQEAVSSWERALALRPADSVVLRALGHAELAAGSPDAAATHLTQLAELEPADPEAAATLVEAHRAAGRLEDALAVARRAWEDDSTDVRAGLDVAELSLELGRPREARNAFARLRELDPEHELLVLFGLLEAAIASGDWPEASTLAAQASRRDPSGATADLLVFAADRAFGSVDRSATTMDVGAALDAAGSGVFALPVLLARDRPVPERSDVERRLREARAQHRRLHVEERVLTHDD